MRIAFGEGVPPCRDETAAEGTRESEAVAFGNSSSQSPAHIFPGIQHLGLREGEPGERSLRMPQRMHFSGAVYRWTARGLMLVRT